MIALLVAGLWIEMNENPRLCSGLVEAWPIREALLLADGPEETNARFAVYDHERAPAVPEPEPLPEPAIEPEPVIEQDPEIARIEAMPVTDLPFFNGQATEIVYPDALLRGVETPRLCPRCRVDLNLRGHHPDCQRS